MKLLTLCCFTKMSQSRSLHAFFFFGFLQVVDSEEDSDIDTGFHSDEEEAPPAKRRSLLVALR